MQGGKKTLAAVYGLCTRGIKFSDNEAAEAFIAA